MFPFVLILEASVGPIFVKYVFNLLAILLLSVIVSHSTLNKHGMCFLMLFLFVIYFIIFHVFCYRFCICQRSVDNVRFAWAIYDDLRRWPVFRLWPCLWWI